MFFGTLKILQAGPEPGQSVTIETLKITQNLTETTLLYNAVLFKTLDKNISQVDCQEHQVTGYLLLYTAVIPFRNSLATEPTRVPCDVKELLSNVQFFFVISPESGEIT